MAQYISDLPIGSLVMDTETQYKGEPIIWMILGHNLEGDPEGSVKLISMYLLNPHIFDGAEHNSPDSEIAEVGNGIWRYSNIRQWLNSPLQAEQWYIEKYDYDEPPTNENSSRNCHGYLDEAGFLRNISSKFLSSLLRMTYSTLEPSIGGAESVELTDFFILPDEVDLNLFNGIELWGLYTGEGIKSYNKAIIENNINDIEPIEWSDRCSWWLRTTWLNYPFMVFTIDERSHMRERQANESFIGIRPMCCIKDNTIVSSNYVDEFIYVMDYESPCIRGEEFNYGGLLAYRYEVVNISENTSFTITESLDGEQIRKFEVSLGEKYQFEITKEKWLELGLGEHTVNISVTNEQNKSDNKTLTFTKSENIPTAPIISGVDDSLGEIIQSYVHEYFVNDINGVYGDTVTVVESIDKVVKRTYTADLGVPTKFEISEEDWLALDYGAHFITIKATDSTGLSATREWKFIKRNHKPAISGADKDLGTIPYSLIYNYIIYDDNFYEGDIVKVVEKIDDKEIRSFDVTEQKNFSINLIGELYLKLSNGRHTLKITATDSQGLITSRTIKFTKHLDIIFFLRNPIQKIDGNNERALEAIISISTYIPTGAFISVEICNNIFDAYPKWEDCTKEALKGENYQFKNADKTSEKWGVNMRVIIKRNTATETPFINGLSLKLKY